MNFSHAFNYKKNGWISTDYSEESNKKIEVRKYFIEVYSLSGFANK